ncbi:MAG: hypothetical protein FWC67_04860 [Defluviitaleaceae bacterium]|nr:hypothetical protein [Defluviitaleaceae bacterium]
MQSKFTQKAQEAIKHADTSARKFSQSYIGTEHLLLGLARANDSISQKVLQLQNATADVIEKKIDEILNAGQGDLLTYGGKPQGYTPRTKRILEKSNREAQKMSTNYVGTEHLLLALIKESDSLAVQILASLGVNMQRVHDDIMVMLSEYTPHIQLPQHLQQHQQTGQATKTSTPTLD